MKVRNAAKSDVHMLLSNWNFRSPKVARTPRSEASLGSCSRLCPHTTKLDLCAMPPKSKVHRHIEKDKAPVFDVDLQRGSMVEAVVYVARHDAVLMTLARMLRGFEIAIAVVP